MDAALASFAAACQRPVAAVAEAVLSYRTEWTEYEPHLVAAGPREVFRLLDVAETDATFEGVYYFHGTRIFDTTTFRKEGILPLGQMIDRLWASLYTLVADIVTDTEWRRLRADIEAGAGAGGYQYCLKTPSPNLHGPYAHLAREHHLPRDGHHNYLTIPEIVEDIARSCGLDLAQRFQDTTTPCVVKFRTTGVDTETLHAGFWYIHGMLHNGTPGWFSQSDYDGRGNAVPPEDVVSVELIDATR
ncbi:hypothetical protein [Amycolatopsis camponoti]|uniref:hypothetical protein n=1 Tax=Amycolatopsis camponoti TaxID=2606593 RepID=UPI0012D749E2|nr:hypothetical protein [Amycolatopsis camponoti]